MTSFQTRVSSPVTRAAALAAEASVEDDEFQENAHALDLDVEVGSLSEDGGLSADQAQQQLEQGTAPRKTAPITTGVFQRIPQVSPSNEIIGSALRRSERVSFNKKLKNETARVKNRAARQLDTLTKEVAGPLGRYIKGFPAPAALHPFERALLELTVGEERYLKSLARVDALRKAALEVGKSQAGRVAKCQTKKDALLVQQDGFDAVARVYARDAAAVDSLKEVAKGLRKLPVVNLRESTVALVGAPNVGKSSLVQVISSGTPEVCNYPFTTRSIKMGHFYVDGRRHQVTDTPGLLARPDEDRNAMERLTLACLQHLPSHVLFVMDLTGECGTSLADQWAIRHDVHSMFPGKPWLDVFSKADLLEEELDEAQERLAAGATGPQSPGNAVELAMALPHALRVSSLTGDGMEELKESILETMQQVQRQREAAAASTAAAQLEGGVGHEASAEEHQPQQV